MELENFSNSEIRTLDLELDLTSEPVSMDFIIL